AALPDDGYFALLQGTGPDLPTRNDLPDVRPSALDTAAWLAETGDPAAARRVLAFALRDLRAEGGPWTREREARLVALGEALVALGEYRIPQRAAATRVDASEQLRTWRLAYPRAWPNLVEPAAAEAGVDPHLAWAVMRRESAFYPRAISRSGAQGLMQVMPATWDWLAELQGEPPADPFAVHANVRYGVHYLGWLDAYFDGDETLLVASYNRGQGYVGRLWESAEVNRDRDELLHAIDARETREYLQNVTYVQRVYDGLAALEATLAATPRE
ncbi:MAG: lytic transglycosylase domain-containing protein, partial [Trueperaceae bacterium]|nr:lytic transglycosylase domain-containing protein [Trueperaceae bacterium]